MTDAASATSLTDVWNNFLAVAGRLPIELKVALALGGMLLLILIIDGIRANLIGRKPQALHIVRVPHGFIHPTQRGAAQGKAPPTQAFKVKRVRKISRHKALRPSINRVSFGESPTSLDYQPSQPKSLREQIDAPL